MKKIYEYDLQTMAYSEAFDNMMRGHHLATDEVRIIAQGEASTGVYRLPTDAESRFTAARNQRSVMRPLCTTLSVAQGDNKLWVADRDSTAEWLVEGQQYPEVTDSFTRIQSYPKKLGTTSILSCDIVNDANFSIIDHLTATWGRRFASVEDKGILCGTGKTGELNGLANTATQMSISSLSYGTLLDVYFTVPVEYRDNSTWVVSDVMYLLLRSLVDSSNRPLMDISSAGETLLGRPVKACLGAPDDALYFGDFSHLWVMDRSKLMVSVLNEMYASRNAVGFHGYELLDCVLTRPEAVVCATIGAEAVATSEDEDEATEASELAVVDAEE